MRAWTLAIIAAFAGALTGCLLKPTGAQQPLPQDGKSFAKADELGADQLPYEKARLILAGTPLNVTMSKRAKPDGVEFDIKAGEETLEVERYQLDDHGFRFSALSDETFVPPIPLARFPGFKTGETWDWSGQAGLGPNKKPATATLTSTWETVNLAGGVAECVVVSANLVVKSDGTDSKRVLKFWIQPKKGIVKREFGYSSTREPRPAGDS